MIEFAPVLRMLGCGRKARKTLRSVQLSDTPSISFCTTCMGRLHHIKQTFIKNIEDNRSYPNAHFVLLNYNSPDGLDEWARKELRRYISEGLVDYYFFSESQYFRMAHAKNVAHKTAQSNILVNVDADNFIGKDIASYVAQIFVRNPDAILHGIWKIKRGSTGRIAINRESFLCLGGYNERMNGWGIEDEDFIARAMILGLKDEIIFEQSFLQSIPHTKNDSMRYLRANYLDSKKTYRKNFLHSIFSILAGNIEANFGANWGKAKLIKNFKEEVFI